MQDKLLEPPKWLKLVLLNTMLVVCLFALSPFYPVLLIYLLFPLMISMFLHIWNKGNTERFARSFPQLNLLINISKAIEKKGSIFSSPTVLESTSSLKSIQRKIGLMSMGQEGGMKDELAQLATYFLELIRAFF